MSGIYIALIESSDDDAEPGSRLLGRIADPDIVELARERLAERIRSRVARLDPELIHEAVIKGRH